MESASILLSKAWKGYKPRFWELTLAIWIPTALVALIGNSGKTPQGLIVVLLAVLVSAIVNLGVIYAVVENIPVIKALKKALSNILGYWWIMILMWLIVMGGTVLLLVPGIIFSVWFMMARYVFILEKQRGLNVLLRSKEYTEGHGWEIFWKMIYLLPIGIGLVLAAVIAGMLLSLIVGGQFMLGSGEQLLNMVMAFVTGIITVLGAYYFWGLFENLRGLKPELRDKPVSGKKGWWVAAAVWGLVAMTAIPAATLAILNPTNLLKEARDSQRITDLNTLKLSLDLYSDIVDQIDFSACAPGKVFSSDNGSTATDGTGWLPINFDSTPGGSPVLTLPKDPSNTGKYIYKFACKNENGEFKFELDGVMESGKYKSKMIEDKGNDDNIYEVGTVSGLDLIP